MNKYFKLVIPFQKRSVNMNVKTKIFCSGTAYFIIDKSTNKIVHEFMQITEANYRLTDKDLIYSRIKMKSGIYENTDYYKPKKYGRIFRDEILDSFTNHDPLQLNTNSDRRVLTKSEIDLVNNYFKQSRTTVKNMFAALSGSNITGAELNNEASPLIMIDARFFESNFLNPLKKITKLDKKFDLSNIENITKEVTFATLIDRELIPGFKEIFDSYNIFLEYRDCEISNIQPDEEYSQYEFELSNEKLYKPNDKHLLYIKMYLEGLMGDISKTILNNKLHSFFSSNCRTYIKNNHIPLFSTIAKFNLKEIDNAHIKSVETCIIEKTEKSLIEAINPYNCLRIPTNAHRLIDKSKYYINIKGDLVDNLSKIREESYIDINNLPRQTIKFINDPNAFK
ncbi:MAG: MAG4270 family putative restriction endonuclease [Mycoplasma sp.]